MRSFVAVVLGLVVGIGAAVGAGAALVALIPAPVVRVSPPPSQVPASPAASTAPAGSTVESPAASPAPPAPAGSPASGGLPAPGGSSTPAAPGSGAAPTPAASRTVSPFPLVGRAAPALTAPQVGGGTIDLVALRGKPVWVVFTGTYCPPCRDEYPLMNGFAARYADTGLVVLAIHVREAEQTVAPFVSSLNVVFPVGLDTDGTRARTWDAAALPVHYFVDAQGIVRDAALGGIGPDVMARGLQAILPGVTVAP